MAKPFAADELHLSGQRILAGVVDPSAGAGVYAAVGSFFARFTTGDWYRKTGPSDTSWLLVGSFAGSDAWYGHGPDGSVVLAPGTTTLTLPMWYEELIVPAGATLVMAGFPVYCRWQLVVEPGGVITTRGSDGASGAGGGAGGGGGGGATSVGGSWVKGGTNGGNGSTSVGANGTNIATGAREFGSGSFAGGAGGAGSSSAGGNGGTWTPTTDSPINVLPGVVWGVPALNNTGRVGGGTGGGGGGGGGVGNRGGGGGGGGGGILIAAKRVDNYGAITAAGGDGGAGEGTGGGGGGGGGGLVLLTARQFNGNAVDVSGGNGGSGFGAGAPGIDGVVVHVEG